MFYPIKKLIFTTTFNLSLFLMLLIGIQNSSSRQKVNLIIGESVKVPISFIIGVSFISGSILGSLIKLNFSEKKS